MAGDVWTVRADGSDLRRIAAGGASWSPDGTMIAVAGRGVQIFSAGGRLRRTIVPSGPPGSLISTPNWSPDSRRVAFAVAAKTNQSAIFVAAVDGTQRAVPLLDLRTHDGVNDQDPYWSPNGKLLAFDVYDQDHRLSIWTSRADGSDRQFVADDASLSGWVADGDAVVCTGHYKDAPREACPLSGAAPRPLTPQENLALEAGSRSPDGRRTVGVNLSGAIVVTEAGGSDTVVTEPATDDLPEWSRDGTRLTFIRDTTDSSHPGGQAWVNVVGLDQAPPRRLTATTSLGPPAQWLPGDMGIVFTRSGAGISIFSNGRARPLAQGGLWALSPDGTRIAYVRKGHTKLSLYVKSTKGGAERKLADIPPPDTYSPAEVDDLAWAPDGQTLFAVWPTSGPILDDFAYGALHELGSSGAWRTVTKDNVIPRSGIAVSPDGAEVAFASHRGLEVVSVAGGARRILLNATGNNVVSLPQWAPDGSRLTYLSDRSSDAEIWLESISTDGSDRQRISAPGEIVSSYSWRPATAENHSK